jgi:DMSO/TMAO reductase YedYZ molybdopterin-dependent catalytic subunit
MRLRDNPASDELTVTRVLSKSLSSLNEATTVSEQFVLTIDGEVERPLQLSYADLEALPEPDQVCDVSQFHPQRCGDGVTLGALLQRAVVRPDANYVTLHADRDDFHVSVPLAAIRDQGIVVYRLGRHELGAENGGPIRLIIRDPSACHTGELDECANVKYLSRIELTARRGRDTRPTNESDHAALHAAQPPQRRRD